MVPTNDENWTEMTASEGDVEVVVFHRLWIDPALKGGVEVVPSLMGVFLCHRQTLDL